MSEPRGLSLLDRVAEGVSRAFLCVAGAAVILMMLHVTVDVGWRTFGSGAMIGTVEIVSFYYMVILVMLGFGFVEMRHGNIRVDLIVERMPPTVQLLLYLLACALGAAYFGVLCYQSFLDALGSTMRKETVMSNYIFYIWPARWALPLGWFAVCLAVVVNALKALARGRAF